MTDEERRIRIESLRAEAEDLEDEIAEGYHDLEDQLRMAFRARAIRYRIARVERLMGGAASSRIVLARKMPT
jgi:hypothetical protein